MKPLVLLACLALASTASGQVVQAGLLRAPLSGELRVTTPAGLTAALLRGGVIRIAPSLTCYYGNWIVSIPGTKIYGDIALPAARVSAYATRGVSLCAKDPALPVLRFDADDTYAYGVTVWNGMNDRAPVVGGSSTEPDPLKLPNNVMLDRVEILTTPAMGGKRGIQMDTRLFTLKWSRVEGFWYQGADAQAFLAVNGPGPYRLIDNELQGSGENVMFGGSSIRSAANVPSKSEIRGNWFFKPPSWRRLLNPDGTILQPGHPGSVKNVLEFKAMDGATVEDNVFDGCWPDGQVGSVVLLTPRDQYGDSPWAVVRDIMIRRNVWRNTATGGYAISILREDTNFPSLKTARVTIESNLVDSVKGVLLDGGVVGTVRIVANTFYGVRWNLLSFAGPLATYAKPQLTVTGNVARLGDFGINGDGLSPGTPSLDAYAPGYAVTSNVFEQPAARTIPLPSGNTVLASGALAVRLDPATYKYLPGGFGY